MFFSDVNSIEGLLHHFNSRLSAYQLKGSTMIVSSNTFFEAQLLTPLFPIGQAQFVYSELSLGLNLKVFDPLMMTYQVLWAKNLL